MSALVWLLAALGLLVVEALTLDLVLAMLAVAALTTAGATALGVDALPLQLGVFAATSAATLLLVRPSLKARLAPDRHVDGPAALHGSTALVVVDVTDESGQVRLNGELWRARPYAGGPDLPAGTEVVVASVEGATVHVYAPHQT